MIHRVEFHNFKALRNVAFDLERLTVLVGPNASGKTSALEGLHYLMVATEKRPDKVFQGKESPWALASSGTEGEMSLMCSADEGWLRLAKDPDPDFQPPTSPSWEDDRFDHHEPFSESGRRTEIAKMAGGLLGRTPRVLGPAVFLRLDMNQLAAPSYSQQPLPQMQPNGEGLPSVLAYLAANHPDDYQRLLEALREVIPIVRAMRFPRASVTRLVSEVIEVDGKQFTHRGDREYWGNSIEFDMDGATGIPAHAASEGTLLVLGLLTVMMGPTRPRVVLLDDVDRALHPKAQEDLVSLLRKLLDQNPDMQIVATSHSPYLLDHLKPEEVRLTTLREDGSVACGRLDEHPEFEKWKEQMTPGEFWSLVGEKWLVETGGDPA